MIARLLTWPVLCLTLLTGCLGETGPADECTADLPAGARCSLYVADLKPTQFALGRVAVECQKAALEEKNAEALRAWLSRDKNRVPVVVGPDRQFYLTDKHHSAAALLLAKPADDWTEADKRVQVEIKANLTGRSHTGPEAFWDWMLAHDAAWLQDDKGLGPMNPALLPDHLGAMLNDPYRTLSRWVRESCGYLKASEKRCRAFGEGADLAFLEFHWAGFFREKTPLQIGDSPACRHLPYAEGCLDDEIQALIALYPKAMEAALSLDAKAYFEFVGLNPLEVGFNPTGKSQWAEFTRKGCERLPD